MARQTLVSLGYRVLSAVNGEEALQLCSQETPALAILDVIMPKLGGAATAARLTALFPDMQFIITSGYSAEGDKAPAPGDKTHYLQKPYSPTTLGRIIRESLDRASVAVIRKDTKRAARG